jgi:hypothetical protein
MAGHDGICGPRFHHRSQSTTPPPSRGADRVRVMRDKTLAKERAQGMPGAQPHPQPRVQKWKAHELVTTGTPNNPAFPARWFYGFLRDLPGEPGFLATIASHDAKHRSLA